MGLTRPADESGASGATAGATASGASSGSGASSSASSSGSTSATSELSALEAENKALRAEIASLLAAGFTAEDEPIPLEDVLISASGQIQGALDELPARNLRLGPVTLTLRGAFTSSDGALALRFTRTDSDALGEAVVTFSPTRAGALALGGTVPDVTGYTLSLAERKLEAAGCTVDVYKLTGAPAETLDRVTRQDPEAGEPLTAGLSVRVWVGA